MSKHRLTLAVLGAAVIGWIAGSTLGDLQALADVLDLVKDLFLSVLRMIIAPLIFFSLITGILRLAQAQKMRTLGLVTVCYYLTTTGIAIAIGLGVVFFVHPWTSEPPLAVVPDLPQATLIDPTDGSVAGIFRTLLGAMFVNPFRALAELNILGIVTNAMLIGLAGLLALPKDSALPSMLEDITRITYRLAGWAILLIPAGVFAIAFEMAASANTQMLGQLISFALVVFAATALHGLVILPMLAWWLTGIPPWVLLHKIAQPLIVALTTSSSAATLPVSLRVAERELGIDPSVSSFVLPLGATINMDGTALFEGVAAVFAAYLFGIELGVAGTITVFLVAMMASIGAPGIPSGSMAAMQIVLLAVGIPLEAIALLLLVERPLDTFRTAVNVEGDLIGALVANRFARAA
ncbi:MAG: dicarboxylate/amino acid:cation symporter [Proteobacteria bacterium]|nr:dicarboxylate/amino acid:cation symporter [Pseudomonadota bacterium]